MNESLQEVVNLSPMAAIVVIGGVLESALTQWAKQSTWSKAKTQRTALGLAAVIGVVAYVVSGVAVGIPDQWQEVVGSAVVMVAGVAIMGRAAYALMGHAVPDGTDTLTATKADDGTWSVAEEADDASTRRADG